MGDEQFQDLAGFIRDSLFVVSGVYRMERDGSLWFDGVRPGQGWHKHGHCDKTITFLEDGDVVTKQVHKSRWLLYHTTQTCHSRPPDDVKGSCFCTLILALKLFSWLSTRGVHTSTELLENLEGVVHARSAQRVMARLLPYALQIERTIQHTIRTALKESNLERSEPRPFERLFPGGLSPPDTLLHRPWQDPLAIRLLWRALAMILFGAAALGIHPPILMAEARGRWKEQ